MFRVAFLRHSHIRIYLRNSYRSLGGILPMISALLVARGVMQEDSVSASRFRALANLPEETLGYQFFRHYTDAGLAFPGEKGGFINLAPFPMPVLLGRIGQGNLAMEVLRGLQRGAAMKVDLGNNWDFWEYVELPIEVARGRLGIPPLSPA